MPQLDFANPLTISQIVWLAVIFAVLYLLLSRWALPRVGSVLNDRATRIATDLDSARAAKAEADAAAREVREAGKRSHAEAQAEIAAAVTRAKLAAAEQAAVLNAALADRIARSEQAIAEAQASARASLREIAISVANGMIERLTGAGAEPAAVDAAVGSLMAQRSG